MNNIQPINHEGINEILTQIYLTTLYIIIYI